MNTAAWTSAWTFPPLDSPTLLFAMAVSTLPLAAIGYIQARSMPRMGLAQWSCAMVSLAVSYALYALRGHAPSWATYVLANALTLLAISLFVLAYTKLLETRPPWRWMALASAIGLSVVVGVEYFGVPMRVSVVIMSLAVVCQIGFIVWLLWRHCHHLHQGLSWFSKITLGGVALAYAVRAAQFASPEGAMVSEAMPAVSEVQRQFLLIGLLLYGISTTTFLALVGERHRKEVVMSLRRDGLTGLYTRTAFEAMCYEIEPGGNDSIILLDIDRFKAINDRLGHAGGDAVLAYVGRHLQGSVRLNDLAVRYGGDELLVLLRDCSSQDAAHFAERMVQEIRQQPLRLQEADAFELTLSAGCAARRSDGAMPESLAAWIARADQALYQAKASGRNRAVQAD